MSLRQRATVRDLRRDSRLDEAARYIGAGIANLVNLFKPAAILPIERFLAGRTAAAARAT